VRYPPFIAAGLVGWEVAMAGIATNDAVAVFGGVTLVTVAIVRGFLTLERGAGDPPPHGPREASAVAATVAIRVSSGRAQVPLTLATAR
jgi:hypothetical protein